MHASTFRETCSPRSITMTTCFQPEDLNQWAARPMTSGLMVERL